MIAVETVIRKLVSEYEFVIIPGFGALLSHQVPAVYDADSGVFSPPVKKLAFNEYLKLDDGLLANFISREEKLPHLEAVLYVKKYTDILRSELKLSEKTKIEGIGEFRMNVEGKLVFEPNTEKYFKDEWYGFTSVTAKLIENFNVTEIPVIGKEEEDEVELVESKTLSINWVRWTSAAVVAGLLFFVSFFLVSTNNGNIKSTLNPFSDLFTPKSVTVAEDISPEPKKPAVPQAPRVKESIKKEIGKTDSLPLTSPPAEGGRFKQPKSNNVVLSKDNKNFYLIAGAFKGMRQAKVLMSELQAKGYTETIIIPSSKWSKKVKVAVQGFDNEKEAYHASAQLKSVIGEPGWVLKRQ